MELKRGFLFLCLLCWAQSLWASEYRISIEWGENNLGNNLAGYAEPWRVPDVKRWPRHADPLLLAGVSDHWWTYEQNKDLIQVSEQECRQLGTHRLKFLRPPLYALSDYPLQLNVHADMPEKFHNDIQLAVDTWNSAAGHPVLNIKHWSRSGWRAFIKTLYFTRPLQDLMIKVQSKLISVFKSQKGQTVGFTSFARANVGFNSQLKGPWLSLAELREELSQSAPAWSSSSMIFYNVLLHELGHVLDLNHIESTEGGITMPSAISPRLSKKPLSLTEVKLARCLAR